MKIEKTISKNLKRSANLFIGHINVDANYFIKKIDKGILQSDFNYKTAVVGQMTDWDYFLNDKKCMILLMDIFDFLDGLPNIVEYELNGCWGIKESFSEYTRRHDHKSAYYSGGIYLNDHSQELYFPDLNTTVKPKKGRVFIFSSFLTHYTLRNKTDVPKYGIVFNLMHSKWITKNKK